MALSPTPINKTFEINTITNGYLVSLRATPSSSDPLGQYPLVCHVETSDKIGAAVDALLEHEREQERGFERIASEYASQKQRRA